jgi:hypothetical protein
MEVCECNQFVSDLAKATWKTYGSIDYRWRNFNISLDNHWMADQNWRITLCMFDPVLYDWREH